MGGDFITNPSRFQVSMILSPLRLLYLLLMAQTLTSTCLYTIGIHSCGSNQCSGLRMCRASIASVRGADSNLMKIRETSIKIKRKEKMM